MHLQISSLKKLSSMYSNSHCAAAFSFSLEGADATFEKTTPSELSELFIRCSRFDCSS